MCCVTCTDLTGFLLTYLLSVGHFELSERGRQESDSENSEVRYIEKSLHGR